jgi:transcriptional regulator with XRE-family HTH domain
MPSTPQHPRRLTEADQHVGRQVRIFRTARGLTLTEAASELGISCQMLNKYERGESRIGAGRLQAIAKLFDIPVSAFLDDEGERRTGRVEFDLLKTPGAMELLRLYVESSDEAERRRMLTFVVAAADLQA